MVHRLHGIAAAAASGIVAGDADAQLQVIAKVSDAEQQEIAIYLDKAEFAICTSDKPYVFHIVVELTADGHTAWRRSPGITPM